jgi:hypothetical protein
MAHLALLYCLQESHKRHDFQKKNVFDMEYVVIFSGTSFHPGRIQQDIIINILWSSFVVPNVFVQG